MDLQKAMTGHNSLYGKKTKGNTMQDTRPKEYHYWDQLMQHLGGDTKIFDAHGGEFVYPRQFEIHLPGNHKIPCMLHCPHCAGKLFDKSLGTWEMTGLELLDKLKGAIPYHIYGGAYTEPILNPYFMTFLNMTKKYGNHFGIHTNGVYLKQLENMQGWLTELNRISSDSVDYLSVSLDAGFPWSWAKTKGTKHQEWYNDVIEGIRMAVNIRRRVGLGHAIRLCYLISPHSGTDENFGAIVQTARDIGVDSLRFSIPFACYNQEFDEVRKYKAGVEQPLGDLYEQMLSPYLSTDKGERPYIFYTGPEFTDIDKFTFNRCLYGYYQITFGADGYIYRCSTTATPTAKQCRLGKITSNVNTFEQAIIRNHDRNWDCQKHCFANGVRCNRMGLEINTAYAKLHVHENENLHT